MHTSFIYSIQSQKYMSTSKRFLYRERFLNPEHYIYNLLLLQDVCFEKRNNV